jgi:hypothetical protein
MPPRRGWGNLLESFGYKDFAPAELRQTPEVGAGVLQHLKRFFVVTE